MSLERLIKKKYRASRQPSTTEVEFADKLHVIHDPDKKTLRPYINYGRRAAIIAGCVGGLILVGVPAAFIAMASIRFETHPRVDNIRYSLVEAKAIEKETFKALNGITYQEQAFQLSKISSSYRKNVNDFAFSLNQNVDLRKNAIYSPLAAYISTDLFSFAANEEVQAIYKDALGDKAIRNEDYSSMLRTNFYVDENGTTQIYNGMFFNVDKGYEAKQGYVDFLTSRNVEAFHASFANDLGKIADWGNQKAGEAMLSPSSFDKLTDDSALLGITYLHFKAHWANVFLKEKTTNLTFHPLQGEPYLTPFMVHTIYADPADTVEQIIPYRGAYEYEKYFSAYDQYKNGYSVQYLVPKEASDSIYDLLQGVNFLEEDPEKYFFGPNNEKRRYGQVIEFNVPKFELTATTDLTDAMAKTKLKPLYDGIEGPGALSEGIDFKGQQIDYSGLEWTEQINRIQFNEDGTEATTFHFQSSFAAGAAAPMSTGLRVMLDQPFVYVIRDPNGLPMYIGSVANPKA